MAQANADQTIVQSKRAVEIETLNAHAEVEPLRHTANQLRELKASGVEITRTLDIPLVAYTGDTEYGPYLFRDEFASAKVVISECTFFEAEHLSRATIGKHLHDQDIAKLLEVWQAETVILVHLTRRTNMATAREQLVNLIGEEQAMRVHFLMDHRANRLRYERQEIEIAANAR